MSRVAPIAGTLFSPHPRPSGAGFDKGRGVRFVPLLEARSQTNGAWRGVPGALLIHAPNGRYRGGRWAMFGISDGAFLASAPFQNALQKLAVRMRGDLLYQAGSDWYTAFPGRALQIGARLASTRAPLPNGTTLQMRVTQQSSGREVWRRVWKGGQWLASTRCWLPPRGANGAWRIETSLRRGGEVLDEIKQDLHVWNYAAARAQRDLLVHQPDFVLVEFGVNDGDTRDFAEHYEGLLRQILKEPQNPAVLLLFMKYRGGGNAQTWQSRLGRYCQLPMVSFRDAVQPEIDAGRMKEEDVMADVVHPNDRGHELTAEFVTHLLQDALSAAPADEKIMKTEELPPPLLTDVFENIRFYDGANLHPTKNDGWKFDAPSGAWIATAPGSVLECEVEGEAVETMTFRVKGPMGRARVQVDDLPPTILEGWFDQTWGGYISVDVVARDLKPGKHRVRVEVLEEKAAESTGHEFRLFGVAAAGAIK